MSQSSDDISIRRDLGKAKPINVQSNGRLGMLAGGGVLPLHVAQAARIAGEDPFIVALENEADQDWTAFDHQIVPAGDFASIKRQIKTESLNRMVMAGSVRQRPQLLELRPTFNTLVKLPMIIRDLLSGGDDKLLRSVIALIEAQGCKIIGAHEVVPNLLAETGPLGTFDLSNDDALDIKAAMIAAQHLGQLDIGQGTVAVGGRVIALEGLEGTDSMLERVAQLRADGRLPNRKKGVLVKLCKPNQDMRADLPTIGPQTVMNAAKAGLAGIVVEAGRSFIVQRADVIATADQAGVFVVGKVQGQ